MLYCALLLAVFAREDFSQWALVPEIFWVPHGFFAAFEIPIFAEPTLRVLQGVWKLALVTATLGLWTRSSLGVACIVGGYLLSIANNFGKVGHGEAVAVLVLLVLALSRCGDAVSIDSLLRVRRTLPGGVSPAGQPSGHYRWPIRAVWTITSLILFSAGYSKLYNSGWEWTDAENLATIMIAHQYFYGGRAWTNWGVHIAQVPVLTSGLAMLTIAVETGMPLALLHPRFRLLLVPSACAMIIGFPMLLGPFFLLLLGAFVFWIPWDYLRERLWPALR